MIRNQSETYIPKLFIYSQLLIVTEDFERQYHVIREKSQITIDVDGETESYKIFRSEKKQKRWVSMA